MALDFAPKIAVRASPIRRDIGRLGDKSKFLCIVLIHGYGQEVRWAATHLAAYFGLRDIIMALLKNGHDPDVKDGYGRTPLSQAAREGHEAVVKLLVEKGAPGV